MNQPLLLFPAVSTGEAVEALKVVTTNIKDTELVKNYGPQPENNFLQSLHHVATKIKADLKATLGHIGYDNLSRDAAD